MDEALFVALDLFIKELDQQAQEQAVKFRPLRGASPVVQPSPEMLGKDKSLGEREVKLQTAVQKEQALKRTPPVMPPKEGVSEWVKDQYNEGKNNKHTLLAQRQESELKGLHHAQEQTGKTLARHQEQEAKLLTRGGPDAQQREAFWKRLEHTSEQEFKLRERANEQKRLLQMAQERTTKEEMMREMLQKMIARREQPPSRPVG